MEAVACAVTFGTVIAQLGVSTIKLKNLWDEIAGVPEKIKDLLEEMELFRMLFAEMETSIVDPAYPNLPLSFWTGHLMQLSLNRAKRAVTALETVTRELDDRLKTKRIGLKRTMVAIRGLMNKEKIQSLEKRLKKAVNLLWMSYDLFFTTLSTLESSGKSLTSAFQVLETSSRRKIAATCHANNQGRGCVGAASQAGVDDEESPKFRPGGGAA